MTSAIAIVGSGNCVGAPIAAREARIKGQSVEAAIVEGKRWGLTSLEGLVRRVLEESVKSEPRTPWTKMKILIIVGAEHRWRSIRIE